MHSTKCDFQNNIQKIDVEISSPLITSEIVINTFIASKAVAVIIFNYLKLYVFYRHNLIKL